MISVNTLAIIGDCHGSKSELLELLNLIGFEKDLVSNKWVSLYGHYLVSVGDTIDRGSDSVFCLKTMMELVEQGLAGLVASNHDDKLRRYLRDELSGEKIKVKIGHDFSITLSQVNEEERKNPGFKKKVYEFLKDLPYKLDLKTSDGTHVIVVHGALKQAKKEKVAREIALVGETDGSKSPNGYPIRTYNWIDEYTGPAKLVVIGHDKVEKPTLKIGKQGLKVWLIDTGCYDSGSLTAILLPQEKFMSVKSQQVYRRDL